MTEMKNTSPGHIANVGRNSGPRSSSGIYYIYGPFYSIAANCQGPMMNTMLIGKRGGKVKDKLQPRSLTGWCLMVAGGR